MGLLEWMRNVEEQLHLGQDVFSLLNPSLGTVLKQSAKLQLPKIISARLGGCCSMMGHLATPVQPKVQSPPVVWHGRKEAVCLHVPACAGIPMPAAQAWPCG